MKLANCERCGNNYSIPSFVTEQVTMRCGACFGGVMTIIEVEILEEVEDGGRD